MAGMCSIRSPISQCNTLHIKSNASNETMSPLRNFCTVASPSFFSVRILFVFHPNSFNFCRIVDFPEYSGLYFQQLFRDFRTFLSVMFTPSFRFIIIITYNVHCFQCNMHVFLHYNLCNSPIEITLLLVYHKYNKSNREPTQGHESVNVGYLTNVLFNSINLMFAPFENRIQKNHMGSSLCELTSGSQNATCAFK